MSKLGYPYNDCETNLDNIDSSKKEFLKTLKMNNKNRTYNQKDCFELCFQNSLIDYCGCYATFLIRSNFSVPCINLNQTLYLDSYTKIFYNKDVKKKCSQFCPLLCDSIDYSLLTSIADYPSLAYIYGYLTNESKFKSIYDNRSIINDVSDYFNIKYSVVSMNVYYEDLKYTEITESPKMLSIDLLAALGGTLGLCMGISVLSMIEILELFLQFLVILFEHSFSNRVLSVQ